MRYDGLAEGVSEYGDSLLASPLQGDSAQPNRCHIFIARSAKHCGNCCSSRRSKAA